MINNLAFQIGGIRVEVIMHEGKVTIKICLRVILGSLFIWAGTMKLFDLDSFVESVSYFKIAPFDSKPWDMWLGYMLPMFEILAGAALIFGVLLRGAMVSVLLLSAVFLVAVISAHMRGLNYECGCFGKALSFTNYSLHVTVLVIMTLMAVFLIVQELINGGQGDQNKLA